VQLRLTAAQSDTIRQHIQQADLRLLVYYSSGRLEAEFVEPDATSRRLDLTPGVPRRKPRGRQLTLVWLFGGMIWSGFWFLAQTVGWVSLPTGLLAVFVVAGLAVAIAGIVLAERQLGTPLLISPAQSKVLRRLLKEGSTVHGLAGGGGTSLLGRGDLVVSVSEDGKAVRYLVSAAGAMRPLEDVET